MSETLAINKFKYSVVEGTIEDHETKMKNFFRESGLLIIQDHFHFGIKDPKKWLVTKIKYGF